MSRQDPVSNSLTRLKDSEDIGMSLKWQESCSSCSGPCLEADFKTKIDYVCLTNYKECVWKGYFLKDPSASEVVVTRGCPGTAEDHMDISFKCQYIEGILFSSDSSGKTKRFIPSFDKVIDAILPEGAELRFVLEGKRNKNNCLVSNFYNTLKFPVFSSWNTGGRKAREISICCTNIAFSL